MDRREKNFRNFCRTWIDHNIHTHTHNRLRTRTRINAWSTMTRWKHSPIENTSSRFRQQLRFSCISSLNFVPILCWFYHFCYRAFLCILLLRLFVASCIRSWSYTRLKSRKNFLIGILFDLICMCGCVCSFFYAF